MQADNPGADPAGQTGSAFDEDFVRGGERLVSQLTETLDQAPDVGQSYSPQAWNSITQLAWRPAWSIRSRRGALAPLLQWWRERREARGKR